MKTAVPCIALVLFLAGCQEQPAPVVVPVRYDFQVAANGILWRTDRQTGAAAYALPGGANVWHEVAGMRELSDAAVFLEATNTFDDSPVQTNRP